MASKPLESIDTEISVDDVGTEKSPGDENDSNKTPTLVHERVVNQGEMRTVDGEDEPSIDISDDDASNQASPQGLINEYNSAVNYISNLIDQLRDKPGVPRAVKSFAERLAESELDSRVTHAIPDGTADGSHTILLADSQASTRESASMLLASSQASDGESSATMQLSEASAADEPEKSKDLPSRKTQVYPTAEKGQRRSMIHNLREAAHLATSASLELNDCATFAYRAYYCAFLGCASSLFSIILAVISPHATTLGFVVSMATFSLALVLGLRYLISFRAFVNKSAQALKPRAKAIDPTISIS